MRRWLAPGLLALAVMLSAVVVVVTKHGNRELVAELDGLRRERARLEIEHSQLRLEEATLAHPGRIEQQAVGALGMREPDAPIALEGRP